MKPNSKKHNSDPEYLRGLIKAAGLTQAQAAERIGISLRAMQNYLSPALNRPAPYPVQYTLEQLTETRQ